MNEEKNNQTEEIKENEFGVLKFGSPNDVIRKIYSECFLTY